jgi:photosystem II stability/assembly factor-like uncharacterized protein
MFNKSHIKRNLFFLLLFAGLSYAQTSEPEGESPESIIQRDLFIKNRRSGGAEKTLPFDVYSRAMERKRIITEESRQYDNINSTNWVSVNPNGMFYNVTGVNYISGRTNSIAFHPTDPNTIYIGSAQGGAWKTTNGGVNWTVITDGLSNISSGSIVVDPVNPNVLYYGTGELNFSLDSKYGDGIFKSTDAGATWTNVAPAATIGTYVAQMAIDPANTQNVYAATSSGLYKSTDAGGTWTLKTAFNYAMCVIIDPANTQVIFVSSGTYAAGVINKSTDGGNTWTALSSGLPASNKGRIQLAMAPSNHLIIYASIASSATYALLALSRTTDGGTTWTTMATSPNPLGTQGWYDNAIVVKPSDPNSVLVGGLDIYLSTNSGTTLTQKSSWSTSSTNQFSHADIHCLAYNGANLYCGSDGGVYKSTNDGTSWTDLNRTLSTLQFQSADYDPTNVLNLYGGCQDNDKETSTDGGVSWIQRTTGDGGYTIVDPVNTNYIYSQYVNGTLYRSNNSGASFTSIRPTSSTGGLFYNPFEMAPGDHNTIIYAQADVWKTTAAQTVASGGWTRIATTATVNGNVSAIGISTLSTNKIYIGTDNGRILVTTNNGTSWTVTTGLPYVTDFIVDPANDNICYASFGGAANNQVQKTTNGGTTWTNISAGLPNIAANSLILKTITGRALVVGMDAGVYYTTNEGVNWLSYKTGLPNVQVYDLKYHESTGLILAVTHGRGCWTISDSPLPVILAFFNYQVSQNSIALRWATQQEINNNRFEVERLRLGETGSDWVQAGSISGSGTTHETKYYSFTDENLFPGKYNYRLRQFDNNGNFEVFNLTQVVSVNLPGEFKLYQNYPNPANPSTSIDFNLPVNSKVKLIIYNMLGQEMETVINSDLSAGYYTKKIDLTSLSSGIYFYRLSAASPSAGFDKTIKFIVLK